MFANLLPADPEMAKLIEEQRAPYADKLSEELARTEGAALPARQFQRHASTS